MFFESIALLAPVLITLFSVSFRKIGALDEQIQQLQITAMEKYVTKEDLKNQFDRIILQFDKLERKIEAVYMVEHDNDVLLRRYQSQRNDSND